MPIFHQILVAVDGSFMSETVLDEAIRLAQLNGARLRLLHVVDEHAYVNGFESTANHLNEIIPLMRGAGEKLLAHGLKKAKDQGVEADSVLIDEGTGRISGHVAAQALCAQADLIVVGSHGRQGVGRILLGSDAEQIVRHAPVPVLVVRAASKSTTP